MPQVDHNHLPVKCKLCTLLIAELNRSMSEHISDDELPCAVGLEFRKNNHSLEFNRRTKSPTANSHFLAFQFFGYNTSSYSFCRWLNFHMILGKAHQAHSAR